MRSFMDQDFLLATETGRRLFHDYARPCPILDYHNHLPPRDIYTRRRYENLTQLWLEGDHYKWRAMRCCGVPEKYVTGDAPDYEKFSRFARVLPKLAGNPVYHWAHLELQRYFGIMEPLTEDCAEAVWEKTAAMLQGGGFDTVSLLAGQNVKILCTTDDPADSLPWHEKLAAEEGLPFRVLPSFRPDRFLHIDQPGWRSALEELGALYGAVRDFDSLCAALRRAMDHFQALGGRVSDHGFLRFRYASDGDAAGAMRRALAGETLAEHDLAVFQGALMRFLAGEYNRRNMVMQLHLGPIRNNSPRLFSSFGPDAGGDSVGEPTDPFLLGAFLGDLEGAGHLPKTILYGLNPCDNTMLATMAVNFAADGARVQYGAAWWLQDNIRGIRNQLDQLMETGLLAGSVGMLTDSRSFTSFPRHEYFRRILCDKLGRLVEEGLYPDDVPRLGGLVEDICWRNARGYFDFMVP